MKVAPYARFLSENQRDASIEDKLRLCRLHAERQGWTVIDSYSDRAISGASLLRPGIQERMQDAQRRRFEIVLAEAMDRLSRDQEDIAGLFKRMQFAGVRIVTLSEGDVSHLHIGLKGTMNALFRKTSRIRRVAANVAGSRRAKQAAASATATMSCGRSVRMASLRRVSEWSTRSRPMSFAAFSMSMPQGARRG